MIFDTQKSTICVNCSDVFSYPDNLDRSVSYDSWISNYMYLCNQCLSLLMLWVRILFKWGVLDTTLCDKVCQW